MWIVYCTTYTVHCWYIFFICEILVGIAYQFYPEESYYYLFFLLLCHHKTLGTIRRVVNKWQWLTAWLTFFSHWLVSCVLLIFSSTMVMRLTCRFWALNIWESLSQSCVCSAVFCPFQIDGFGFVCVNLKDAYFHFPMMFFFFCCSSASDFIRKLLHFSFLSQTYQFKVPPFGLSLAPHVFTRYVHASLSLQLTHKNLTWCQPQLTSLRVAHILGACN